MNRDEAIQEYREAVAQAEKAKEDARTLLRERLRAFRDAAHEELRVLRMMEQKTKRGKP